MPPARERRRAQCWPDRAFPASRRRRPSMFSPSTKRGEAHGGVDVAPGHVEAEAVGDERHADHQQEAERQHHDGRVLLDEVRERRRGHQHHRDRHDHRDVHDRELVGHAHGGDDRVDREDEVEDQDLEDRAAEGQVQRLAHHLVLVVRGIDRVVDLLGRLPDQEEAARDQDQVAPGEAVPEGGEDGLGQADDEGDGREQDEPHDQRRRDAEAAGPGPVLGGQLVGQDRDEDEVVDAEHHLHRDQRHHGRPALGLDQKREMRRDGVENGHRWLL